MWCVPTIRLVSPTKLTKNIQFFRLKSVIAVARSSSYCSDSGSDEQSSNPLKRGTQVGDEFLELNSNRVMEILNNSKMEPVYALQFFRNLKEHGFKHDVATYVAIIRILCYWGMDISLDSLLLEVIRSKKEHLGFDAWDLLDELVGELNVEGLNLLPRALGAMVKAFVSVGMFEEAIDTLFETGRRGFGISLFVCNYLINRLVQCGMVDKALSVYKQLGNLGLAPNVYTYGIVIKAFCRKVSLDMKLILEVFGQMEKAGVAPNNCIYSTLIEGLCSHGQSASAYNILREYLPNDANAYSVVQHGFIKEKKLKEAGNVFLTMKKHGLVPDYRSLIHVYCQAGHVYTAMALQSEMEAENIKPNRAIASSILCGLRQIGRFWEAVHQFKCFQELGIYLDNVVYNDVIVALFEVKKSEEAQRLFHEMLDKKVVPDVKNYTTLIHGHFVNGSVVDALNVFKEMERNGMKPDIVTYNVLAGGFSRNGFVDRACKLVKYMKGQGIEPNYTTYNMIIKGLCISGKVQEAENFLKGLEEKSIENYAAFIDSLCESRNAKYAYKHFTRFTMEGNIVKGNTSLKLLVKLLDLGAFDEALMLYHVVSSPPEDPCMKMFGIVIAALCRAGDMKKARDEFDYLIRRGSIPDVIIYTEMLNGYFRVNCSDKARVLFKSMKEMGVIPDIKTYTVMLKGYSKHYFRMQKTSGNKGEMDRVLSSLLDEMNEMGVSADVVCNTVLIDIYCNSNNLEDAENLFNKMTEIGIAPDVVAYRALLNGYRKMRCIGKAKMLIDKMILKGMEVNKHTLSTSHQGILKAKKNNHKILA